MRGLACAIALCAACGFAPRGVGDDDEDGGGGDGAPAPDGAAQDAAAQDARGPDAAGFDPNRCPSRFDHAYRQARYFYLRAGGNDDFVDLAEECAAAAPGLAHVVVLSDQDEVDHLDAVLCDGAGGCDPRIWVGLYSLDGATYVNVTGEPDVRPWDTGANQPVDFDTLPAAAELNVDNGLLVDLFAYDENARFATVCECDGQAQVLPLLDLD